jgi:hypothetical protein
MLKSRFVNRIDHTIPDDPDTVMKRHFPLPVESSQAQSRSAIDTHTTWQFEAAELVTTIAYVTARIRSLQAII